MFHKVSTVRQVTCRTTFFLVRDCIEVRYRVVLLSGFKFKWVGLKVSSCFRIHFCNSCSKFHAPVNIQRFLLGTWIKSSQQVFKPPSPPVCGLLTFWEDSYYYFFRDFIPVSSHIFSQSWVHCISALYDYLKLYIEDIWEQIWDENSWTYKGPKNNVTGRSNLSEVSCSV